MVRQSTSRIPSVELEGLKKAMRTALWSNGVDWSLSKINKLAIRYYTKARPLGFDFFDFVTTQLGLTSEQHDAITRDEDLRKAVELLMMPGNYAGRDHRRHGPHHVSGARRREGEPL